MVFVNPDRINHILYEIFEDELSTITDDTETVNVKPVR